MYVIDGKAEVAMDGGIDARQIERVLSHLARLKHRGDQKEGDVLESLRPTWLRADAWDVVLEDLEAQRYHERARVPRLRLVGE
jgi:hypothetical protein